MTKLSNGRPTKVSITPTKLPLTSVKRTKMNQPIDYLGAIHSTLDLANRFNHRLDTRIQITQVDWAFHIDKSSNNRKPGELNLATSATSKEDLVHIECSVDDQEFSGQPLGTPILRFVTALENVLSTCLKTFESNHPDTQDWTFTESHLVIAFGLDEQNQLEFTKFPRDSKNHVIHKITFTLQ